VTLVGGNTELFATDLPEGTISNFVCLSGVQELRTVEITAEGVLLGAALSISEMISQLEKLIAAEPGKHIIVLGIEVTECEYLWYEIFVFSIVSEEKTVIFVEVVKLMKQFGSEQIRNVAVGVGSIHATYCKL